MRAPPLTHAAVARQLHAKGYRTSGLRSIGLGPLAVCRAVVRAFEDSDTPLGAVPATDADCAEIRAELARIETRAPSPSETRH